MWALKIIIYLFCVQSSIAEIKLLQTLFRHGNRTPVNGSSFYPNDPYVNDTYEPEGFGALTNDGKKLAYKLGQYFRERYDDFLGPLYSKEIIQFYSSSVDRVVMTGGLVAAALFPPVGVQRWSSTLNWQPIPVWPLSASDSLYGGIFCENLKKWRTNLMRTDKDIIKHIKENQDVYKYLSQHTGSNITQAMTIQLRQLLFAQNDIGLKLPEWTKPVFPNGKLDELAAYDITIQTRTRRLKQLLGGSWLKEFLNNIDNYINKTDSRKAIMYAGHELNIAYLLAALKNYNYEIPYYCSSIMFELHEDNDKYYIQIFYKNHDIVQTLKIPGCDDKMCPLDTFKKFVEPVLPTDWLSLCGNKKEN